MRVGMLIVTYAIYWLGVSSAFAEDEKPIIRIGTKPAEVMAAKITVSNLLKSYEFYTKVVGLKRADGTAPPVDDPKSPMIEACLNFSGSLADPYICIVRQQGMVPDRNQARLTWVSVKVPDARAAIERLAHAGFAIDTDRLPASGPMRQGNVVQAMGIVTGLALDPDGYTVQLLQAASVVH